MTCDLPTWLLCLKVQEMRLFTLFTAVVSVGVVCPQLKAESVSINNRPLQQEEKGVGPCIMEVKY